jgi:[ribosomal protein S18]-alanine N-acetyltransferase
MKESMVNQLSNYQVVNMEACHIDEVVEIENKSFKTPWSKDAFVSEIERNKCAKYRVLIIEDIDKNTNRVAAYGGLWHVVDEGHITNIAVHPDFRGRGLGAVIVEDMIACAKQMQISALTLEVRTGNITAINLYQKYGFKEIALRKNYYADTGEDAIIMWKNDIQD